MQDTTLRNHKLLTGSYRYYARNVLRILTDDGIIEFEFNQAQEYLDYLANQQLRAQGYVRIALCKARQQGGSEYVSGRGYKRATQRPATKVYILSHEVKSTSTLFSKVQRYNEFADPTVRPESLTANGLKFKWANHSEYSLGTAGTENTGRSDTCQFGHLSECAWYPGSGEGIKAGLMQTVNDGKSTELWAESTSNGKNWWYHFIQDILSGLIPDWIVVFIPWWWSDKYQSPPPPNFKATAEEEELRKLGTRWDNKIKQIVSAPLTDAQLYWRRKKIGLLGEKWFKQEYPGNLEESFQFSGESFIESSLVERARKSQIEDTYGANILGVDAGRTNDRTIITKRVGRRIQWIKKFDPKTDGPMDEMRLAGMLIKIIQDEDIDACFLDYAQAYGTVDRCKELGWGHIVHGVHFAESANEPQYVNKRAEIGHNFRDWLKDGETRLPDDNDMANDIAAIPEPKITSNGKLQMLSKKEIKEAYGRSPDIYDSITLTFAENVLPRDISSTKTSFTENVKGGLSELTTAARIRRGESSEDHYPKRRNYS